MQFYGEKDVDVDDDDDDEDEGLYGYTPPIII
jgi:hypothetical protein